MTAVEAAMPIKGSMGKFQLNARRKPLLIQRWQSKSPLERPFGHFLV
jgi:hypothetical protein